MARRYIGDLKFAKVYPMLIAKAVRKGRTEAEVDELTCWLTGYDKAGLDDQIARETDYTAFFAEAPRLHPARHAITGLICGHRVEDIEDPVEQQVRQLDKIIDELARGKSVEKIKRN